ncbi:MAG: biotin/lipoyl-containing protein [Thermoanaerobaculia bacterium]
MRRYTITINGKDIDVDVRELAAERFQVRVAGLSYDVAVSEENVVLAAALRAPAPSPVEAPSSIPTAAPTRVPVIEPQATSIPPGASPLISAPMPGVILSVDVATGASVTRGQSLVTLEAMKMRNSIRSPRDGVVGAVHVTAGQSVGHGDPLVEVTSS